jgi:NitT/TauT family transport system ATP-binding protein
MNDFYKSGTYMMTRFLDGRSVNPGAAVLDLQGIGKRFSDQTLALEGVDLTLRPAEFVSVMGPTGCGKTTLLRIAAGLSKPSSGLVAVRTRRVAFALQDQVQAQRDDPHGAAAGVAVVGLGELAGHPPLPLSGAVVARAALAGSPVLRSELLLLDALFRAIDERDRWPLYGVVGQLYAELGFAALLATGSVTEAVLLSRRVIVLSSRPGRILDTFEVPFDYPRPPRLLASSRFVRLAGAVGACLDGAGRGPAPVAVAQARPRLRVLRPERW